MSNTEQPKKLKPREKPHYVNNRQFSEAVVSYVKSANDAKRKDKPKPIMNDYIATCITRICEGLSHKPNFINYTFRDEMVADAIENCVKAVNNYNVDAATRSGKPNAFSYFTMIAWNSFLRTIAREKDQMKVRQKLIERSTPTDFFEGEGEDTDAYVNDLRFKTNR